MALVIIGLMVAIAVPNIAGRSEVRRLELEAQRLQSVIGLLCERAEQEGRVLALAVSKQAYAGQMPLEESTRDGNGLIKRRTVWLPIPNAEALLDYSLPKGIMLSLRLSDGARAQQEVKLLDELPKNPQLPCLGPRSLAPFELQLQLGNYRRNLTPLAPTPDQLTLLAVSVHDPDQD